MRVRIEGLYRSDAMRSHLERVPRGMSDLRVVSANPLTGNALVLFDPRRAAGDVIGELERWASALLSSDHPALSTGVHAAPPGRSTNRRRARARPAVPLATPSESPSRESWHSKAAEETLAHFASTERGLPDRVAAERLDRYGPVTTGFNQAIGPRIA
jgi:Ca2+-transporting ATPase